MQKTKQFPGKKFALGIAAIHLVIKTSYFGNLNIVIFEGLEELLLQSGTRHVDGIYFINTFYYLFIKRTLRNCKTFLIYIYAENGLNLWYHNTADETKAQHMSTTQSRSDVNRFLVMT